LKDWNDQKSWQEFFDTYWSLIYGTAINAGLTDAEAQDVVQETLIAVSEIMPTFQYDRAKGSFKGWLLKLTAWRIADERRKRVPSLCFGERPANETGDRTTHEGIQDPSQSALERIWNDEWEGHVLNVAVKQLKRKTAPKEYQIFDLCVFKQWPVLKVSRTLHVNPARVYRAKYHLSALLKQEIQHLQSTTF